MITKRSELLRRQIKNQARIIWALTMREVITRFGREGLGAIWLIIEPAMFVVGVMFIFSHIETRKGISIAEYLAVSYPTLLFWRNGSGRVMNSLEINQALLHHRPIKPIDVIYSRMLLEFSGASAAFLTLFPIFIAFGICHFPADSLTMVLGFFLIVWFSFSFVLIMAALAALSETVERVSHIILYLMLPFSGVFVPLATLPEAARNLLIYFPLIDAVEYFHRGYYGSALKTYYDIPYTILTLTALTLFSLSLVNVAIRRFQIGQ